MAMKVLYEKESLRLLGAQIVGGDGVDKRIDVLATAIRAKMTALELTELDLSYAPPYSSAKDPVNMAGFMIEDLESGKVRQFHWSEVEGLALRWQCDTAGRPHGVGVSAGPSGWLSEYSLGRSAGAFGRVRPG